MHVLDGTGLHGIAGQAGLHCALYCATKDSNAETFVAVVLMGQHTSCVT